MGRSPWEVRYENNRQFEGESLEEILEKLNLKAGKDGSDDDGGGRPW